MNKITSFFDDIKNITWRNVMRNFRTPQLLVFSSIQPVMFLLLFNFVFGGAVSSGGALPYGHYINFLLPGILAQTALFGAIQTGVGLAEDLGKGAIDRFRSLPIARVAVLAGRTLADAVRNVFVICIMIGVGSLLGFRFHNGFIPAIGAVAIVLLFAYSFSWISGTIGLLIKDSETVQVAGFLWVFPLIFASAVFVPIRTMPAWLQVFARNQPVTQTVNAVRALAFGGPTDAVWKTLLWVAGILIIFVPLAVSRYRKTV